jgi:hypothetical protein
MASHIERQKILSRSAARRPRGHSPRAQQPAMPVIGILDGSSPAGAERRVRGFREGLKESGYLEGENLAIVRRWAEGETDRLPALATDLTRQRVAVLATIGKCRRPSCQNSNYDGPLPWAKIRSGLALSRAWPGPVAT